MDVPNQNPLKAESRNPDMDGKFKVQLRDGYLDWFAPKDVLPQPPVLSILNEGVDVPSDEVAVYAHTDENCSTSRSDSESSGDDGEDTVQSKTSEIKKPNDYARKNPTRNGSSSSCGQSSGDDYRDKAGKEIKMKRKHHAKEKQRKKMPGGKPKMVSCQNNKNELKHKGSLEPEHFATNLAGSCVGSDNFHMMPKEGQNQSKHCFIDVCHSFCIPATKSKTIRELLTVLRIRARGELRIRKLFCDVPASASFESVVLV